MFKSVISVRFDLLTGRHGLSEGVLLGSCWDDSWLVGWWKMFYQFEYRQTVKLPNFMLERWGFFADVDI